MNHQLQRGFTVAGVLLFCLAVLLVGGWAVVEAHADYARSEPAAEAVIAAAPAEVQVWFTQELFRREGANALEVYGTDGTRVDQNDVRIDDDDRTHMLVSLAANLPPDTYTVQWRTLSADDGHDGSGEFRFTVDPAAGPTTPDQPGSAATATVASMPSTAAATPAPAGGLPCLNGLIFGTFGVGLILVMRRQR